jgi:CRP-like cAMP-binding protein
MDTEIEAKIKGFFSKYTQVELKKGEDFLVPGDTPDSVYLLDTGIVRSYTVSKSGQDITTNTYKPVSFFPLGPILNKTENRFYFQAVTAASLYKAPAPQVMRFLNSEPEVVMDLVKRIYRGLEGYMLKIEALSEGSAYKSLVQEIITMVQRFSNDKSSGRVLSLEISENQLASQTGLTRETVSRNLSRLKAKGLIEVNKKIISVPDLKSLEHEFDN